MKTVDRPTKLLRALRAAMAADVLALSDEELEQELEQDQDKLQEYQEELKRLGIELKDFHAGLIDFPSWMGKREVYLCWKLGEPQVAHWHELDAGFAGRRKIRLETADK